MFGGGFRNAKQLEQSNLLGEQGLISVCLSSSDTNQAFHVCYEQLAD